MLNENVIRFRDGLYDVNASWPDYKIAKSIVGLLYSMRWDLKAVNPQEIIDYFMGEFKKRTDDGTIGIRTYRGSLNELMKIVKEILMGCKEFRTQNLSYNNWIDLDAFFQNLKYDLSLELFFDTICDKCKKFDITLS